MTLEGDHFQINRSKMVYKSAMIITGPTTTGKTDVAITVAKAKGGELINSDNFKLYDISLFRIGTGLSDYEVSSVPLHLYGTFDPKYGRLKSTEFVKKVENVVPQILSRGNLPIIEGDSFRYNVALIEFDKNNKTFHYKPIIGLKWSSSKSKLRERIETRVTKAFELGLLNETELILEKGLENTYIMKGNIVYGPIISHLEGRIKNIEDVQTNISGTLVKLWESQTKKFEKVSGIEWIEHDPEKIDDTLTQIYLHLEMESHNPSK